MIEQTPIYASGMSLSISELAAALSLFQGEVKDPMKDKSFQIMGRDVDYADIETVLKAVRPLLAKNGLAITQLLGSMLDKVTITTILMHKSGQYISSTAMMKSEGPKISKQGNQITSEAQSAGSVISYVRRYAICGLLGLAQADNDAQVGKGDPAPQRQQQYSQSGYNGSSSLPAQVAKPRAVPDAAAAANALSEVKALMAAHEVDGEAINRYKAVYRVESLDNMSQGQLMNLINRIKTEYEGGK